MSFENLWTDWACKNKDGSPTWFRLTPSPVCGIQVREQGGYGLVNLRLAYRDSKESKESIKWTAWLTSNFEGAERQPVTLEWGDEAVGISVREQGGYGLVNARLLSSKSSLNSSKWACTNMEGTERVLKLSSGSVHGAQVREQGRYGLVDLRIGSAPPPFQVWMERQWDKIKDKQLWQLVIPGTHDSATYGKWWAGVVEASALREGIRADKSQIGSKCQSATIYEQLSYGIRYFDLRFATNLDNEGTRLTSDKYYVYHGSDISNVSLNDVLKDIKQFLDITQREIFILHIRSDVDDWPKDPAGYIHPKPTVEEDKAMIAEIKRRLGEKNIVDHEFVKGLKKNYPAHCTPSELCDSSHSKRVIIVWWGNHDETIAKDVNVANYVWLSDIIKNGVSTYGGGAAYELAYLRQDDIHTWGVEFKAIQRSSKTRYWYRGGDWKKLQEAVKKDGLSLAEIPLNIMWADLYNENEYLSFADTLINTFQGKCDFERLDRLDWTDWACKNKDGSPTWYRLTPSPVCGIQVREQGGYGLVNLRFAYRDPKESKESIKWTAWLTSNFEGAERQPVTLEWGDEAVGISVREQGGYGLVNARLLSSKSSSNSSKWACTNMEGTERVLKLSSGSVQGAQVREQGRYGLVDVRLG